MLPVLIPSVGPGADPGVQAVSLQVTVSHPPGVRLPLLSARPAVTFPAAEHHRPLAGTKLYCLVTEAHRCKQLAQVCYAALPRVGFEPATYWSQVQRATVALPRHLCMAWRVTISHRPRPLMQQWINVKHVTVCWPWSAASHLWAAHSSFAFIITFRLREAGCSTAVQKHTLSVAYIH